MTVLSLRGRRRSVCVPGTRPLGETSIGSDLEIDARPVIDPWAMTCPCFLLLYTIIHPVSISHYPSFSRLSSACFDDMAGTTLSERAINEITRRPARQGLAPNTNSTQHKLEDGTVVNQVFSFSPLTHVDMLANGKLVTCACLAGMYLQALALATNIPTDEQFFSKTEKGMPDIAYLRNHFYGGGRIREDHALYIIEKATEILHTEPNLLYVDAPVRGGFFPSPLL